MIKIIEEKHKDFISKTKELKEASESIKEKISNFLIDEVKKHIPGIEPIEVNFLASSGKSIAFSTYDVERSGKTDYVIHKSESKVHVEGKTTLLVRSLYKTDFGEGTNYFKTIPLEISLPTPLQLQVSSHTASVDSFLSSLPTHINFEDISQFIAGQFQSTDEFNSTNLK